MDEKFATIMNKFYELYLDMLQDMRVDAKTEERYDILINGIFNNLRLDYNKTSLMIRSDEKFMALLQAIEPRRFKMVLEELQNENKKDEE